MIYSIHKISKHCYYIDKKCSAYIYSEYSQSYIDLINKITIFSDFIVERIK